MNIDQTYNFAACVCVCRDSSMEGLQAIMMNVTCLISLINDVIVNL